MRNISLLTLSLVTLAGCSSTEPEISKGPEASNLNSPDIAESSRNTDAAEATESAAAEGTESSSDALLAGLYEFHDPAYYGYENKCADGKTERRFWTNEVLPLRCLTLQDYKAFCESKATFIYMYKQQFKSLVMNADAALSPAEVHLIENGASSWTTVWDENKENPRLSCLVKVTVDGTYEGSTVRQSSRHAIDRFIVEDDGSVGIDKLCGQTTFRCKD